MTGSGWSRFAVVLVDFQRDFWSDGFLNTELHDVLTARGIKGLMIAGLVTSTCVLFTASTATQLGYHVSVLTDCCSDDAAGHAATLAAYPFIFDTAASTNIADRRHQWDTELATMHPALRVADGHRGCKADSSSGNIAG